MYKFLIKKTPGASGVVGQAPQIETKTLANDPSSRPKNDSAATTKLETPQTSPSYDESPFEEEAEADTVVCEIDGQKIPIRVVMPTRDDGKLDAETSKCTSTNYLPLESSEVLSRDEPEIDNSITNATEESTTDNDTLEEQEEPQPALASKRLRAPPKKRKKRSQRKKPDGGYFTKFNDNWLVDPRFSHWIIKADEETFLCIACGIKKSVKHDGLRAVTEHEACASHKSSMNSAVLQPKMNTFVVKGQTKLETDIAIAEACRVFMAVKHHNSYASIDCESKLLPDIFPDSNIARLSRCGRTKSAAIVRGALAPYSLGLVKDDLVLSRAYNYNRMPRFYSVMTDGSCRFRHSLYPHVVRYFKEGVGVVEKVIGVIDSSSDGTADKLYGDLKSSLKNMDLSLEQVSGFSGDSTAVNFGVRSSVYSKMKEDQNNLIALHCPAHLIHNAAKAALCRYSPDIETLLIRICSYVHSSSKREAALREVYDYCDTDFQQITKHSNVRWLTLSEGLGKLVANWIPLKTFFLELGSDDCPANIWDFLKDQEDEMAPPDSITPNELHLHFWANFSALLSSSIKSLEKHDGTVIDVCNTIEELLLNLEERVKNNYFGSKVNTALNDMDNYVKKKFVDQAILAYTKAKEYIEERYTQRCALFKKCKCIDIQYFTRLNYNDIIDLVSSLGITIDFDLLFSDVVLSNQLLPSFLEKCEGKGFSLPKLWAEFFFQSTCRPMSSLFTIVSFVLSLPASNAFVERIFSVLKRSWSEERNSLLVSSVESEMMVFFNFPQTCSEFPAFLRKKEQKKLIQMVISSKKYLMA